MANNKEKIKERVYIYLLILLLDEILLFFFNREMIKKKKEKKSGVVVFGSGTCRIYKMKTFGFKACQCRRRRDFLTDVETVQ